MQNITEIEIDTNYYKSLQMSSKLIHLATNLFDQYIKSNVYKKHSSTKLQNTLINSNPLILDFIFSMSKSFSYERFCYLSQMKV